MTAEAPAAAALSVDDLAQEIRRIDGRHALGAGALAEALWPWITQQLATSNREREALRADAELILAECLHSVHAEETDAGLMISYRAAHKLRKRFRAAIAQGKGD